MHPSTNQEDGGFCPTQSPYRDFHLSISSYKEGPPGTSTLRLKISDDKDKITKRPGDYQLCHSPDNTPTFKAVHGDILDVSIKSKFKSIRQTTSPFNDDAELDCELKENFNLSVGCLVQGESDRSVSTKVPTVTLPAFSEQSQSSTATNNQVPDQRGEELEFFWNIECTKEGQSYGYGVLTLTSLRNSQNRPKVLLFKVRWPRGENCKDDQAVKDPSRQTETESATRSNVSSGEVTSQESTLASLVKRQKSESVYDEAPPAKKHHGESKGMKLTSGSPLLLEIPQGFTQSSTYHLAAIALENKCKGGGYGFINQHIANYSMPDWGFIAYIVLAEWCCLSKEDVFGADLLGILQVVSPETARQFKDQLLAT